MSHLICCSDEPFQLLYTEGNTIQEINPPNSIQKSYKCNEEIKCILSKSYQRFFAITATFITEYEMNGSLQIQQKSITKNKHLNYGRFNKKNKMLYCVDKSCLYLIDKNGTSCTFPNVRKYLIDQYRFFSFDTRHFVEILEYNDFCVLDTKKMIEKMLQLIWKYTKSFKIKFQCIYKNYFVFLCEVNKRKSLVLVNSKTFLLEFVDIHTTVGDYAFTIVSDTFLYLIICIPNIHNVYLHYHIIEANNIYCLFEYNFFFPYSEDITDYFFYFFKSHHYTHVFTREKTRVIYLFDIQEKLKISLQYEKNEKVFLRHQYQYFQNILYKKNNRIENDVASKTLGKCCICYENNVNILFLPCSHICVCSLCGLKESITSCPMCRDIILIKKTTYILTK